MKPKRDYTAYLKAEMDGSNYFDIIGKIIGFKEQIKIAHWQTTSFAQHKALDGLYDDINGILDELTEVSMGKYGRFSIQNNGTCTLKNLAEVNLETLAKEMAAYLVNDVPKYYAPTDTEILNIRDEMLAAINKFLYLLTLE